MECHPLCGRYAPLFEHFAFSAETMIKPMSPVPRIIERTQIHSFVQASHRRSQEWKEMAGSMLLHLPYSRSRGWGQGFSDLGTGLARSLSIGRRHLIGVHNYQE